MKRSFTSSSRRRVFASLTVFFVTFAIVVVTGQQIGTMMARASFFNAAAIMDVGLTPARPLPDPQDWYVSYEDFGIDHYILYHGLDESIRYAREADVLFLGNSQASFGFPKTVLKQGELETGLRFYNLAFGYGEGSKFALALIEKHDLRPRIVVVNAGFFDERRFFMPRASEFGEKAMESSRWEAWKTIWEWKLTWRVRHFRLMEQLPDWRVLRPPFGMWSPRFIICRSISSGPWHAHRENLRPVPVGTGTIPVDAYRESEAIDDRTLSIAWEFKRALAERGTDMVLTVVPSPVYWSQRHQVASLAAAMKVPFISPTVTGLMTRDGAHLDDESAQRFGVRFLKDFDAWLKESGTGNEH